VANPCRVREHLRNIRRNEHLEGDTFVLGFGDEGFNGVANEA
jgi:hypothetical protein